MRMVRSYDAEARIAEAGFHAMLVTLLLWPLRTSSILPVSGSQNRTVLSDEPEASKPGSGRHATVFMEAPWP